MIAIILLIIFGILFSFNTYSLTLIISDANTTDAQVVEEIPTTNFGNDALFRVAKDSGGVKRAYVAANLSMIPTDATIVDAVWYFSLINTEGGITHEIHDVNTTFNELTINHINQPCATDFTDATKCNLSVNVNGTTSGIANYTLDITTIIKRAFAENRNASWVIKQNIETHTANNHYASRNYLVDPAFRHYINITYTIGGTNNSPVLTINSPRDNSQTHNQTPLINFTIDDVDNDNITYEIYLDNNLNPTTRINYTNDNFTKRGNFTFDRWTITNLTSGSINGTYYLKINGTDNASNVFTKTITFNLTNDINQYNPTNLSITPLPLSSGVQAKCHFNITNKASSGNFPNQTDNISVSIINWYINKTLISTATNNSLLNAPNVSFNANITCEARINNGFGETAWTLPLNSSIITVGDDSPPIIKNMSLQRKTMDTSQTNIFSFECQENTSLIKQMGFDLNFNGSTINHTRVLNFQTGGGGGGGGYGTLSEQEQEVQLEITSFIWNYTIFNSDESARVGGWNITRTWCKDTSNNNITNFTTINLDFNVTAIPLVGGGGDSGGSGGGGGSPITQTTIEKVNITRIENCNQDSKCDKSKGEDPFSCPTDCKVNVDYLTCDNPLNSCIKDTIKNIFTARNPVFRLSLIIGAVSLGVLFYPKTLKYRRKT